MDYFRFEVRQIAAFYTTYLMSKITVLKKTSDLGSGWEHCEKFSLQHQTQLLNLDYHLTYGSEIS